MATIDVLLATYNGTRFLPELLRSLEQQTFTQWRLLLRDDGSTDGSAALVEDWAARKGHPLVVLEDGRQGLGACGNFGALLEASDAPYFALCDQDDAWLPEKLALMLERLREAETRRGPDTPLLAYSDLEVVDEALRTIARSFHAYAGIRPPRVGQEVIDLMTQNVVTGCASLGNAALRAAALPVPPDATMHDWWLALVAASTGEMVEVREATVLYRQHGTNASQPIKWTLPSVIARLATDSGTGVTRARSFISDTQTQAAAFHRRFGAILDREVAGLFEQYGTLHSKPFLKRKRFMIRNALWSASWVRSAVLLAIV